MEYLSDAYITALLVKISTDYTIASTVVLSIIGYVAYKFKIKWLQALVGKFKKVSVR